MSSPSALVSPFGEPPPGARQLARGVTATWWYTLSAIVFLEVFLVLVWALQALAEPGDSAAPLVIAAGGVVWLASTTVLLSVYRRRAHAEPGIGGARVVVPLLIAVAYGVVSGALIDSWQLALMPVAQSLVLVHWPKGIRIRVVLLTTLVLLCVAFVDGARGAMPGGVPEWLPLLYTISLPAMSVSSLWWWDVLMTLDRARLSEARLAATQERLRVATDVHDLQGHHLQVIALQLELAERLIDRDPAAALEQLRLARASVDDARQGTRDLATRFRSVPLGDEVANARDLLSAAGLSVEAEIASDSDEAPAAALGPVIRETTTNVLRHGGGTHARLQLARTAAGWRYEIANDLGSGSSDESIGSGLDGVRRRIAEAGGTLEVGESDGEFVVAVTVPFGALATADPRTTVVPPTADPRTTAVPPTAEEER
ncbi:sensor histidine kinase [Microbacterium sp. H83]|uniref:sensor histidine kinase n=1 Tax=Microbacterium sp. H83 TaxID=1827324 RepID=UPI00082AAB65|nr:histidine kinase [Microbacterium sp. H83]